MSVVDMWAKDGGHCGEVLNGAGPVCMRFERVQGFERVQVMRVSAEGEGGRGDMLP